MSAQTVCTSIIEVNTLRSCLNGHDQLYMNLPEPLGGFLTPQNFSEACLLCYVCLDARKYNYLDM